MESTTRPTARQRISCSAGALTALLVAALAGCDSDIAKEFRAAAVPQLEAGVNALVDGLVSGAFAVADARDPSSSATDATP